MISSERNGLLNLGHVGGNMAVDIYRRTVRLFAGTMEKTAYTPEHLVIRQTEWLPHPPTPRLRLEDDLRIPIPRVPPQVIAA